MRHEHRCIDPVYGSIVLRCHFDVTMKSMENIVDTLKKCIEFPPKWMFHGVQAK
jgi:hypothetical protein